MNRVAFVIHTDRFQDSLTFYREVLELDLVEEWREGGHGAVLSLAAGADIELIEVDVEPGSRGGVALGLEVDDVDSWYDRLIKRGVAVKAPPVDAFGKRGFGAADPNGVAVNIYTTSGA